MHTAQARFGQCDWPALICPGISCKRRQHGWLLLLTISFVIACGLVRDLQAQGLPVIAPATASLASESISNLPDAPVPGGVAQAMPTVGVPAGDAPESNVSRPVRSAPERPDFNSPQAAADLRVPLQDCPTDQTHARECRVHWRDLMIGAGAYLAFQDIGNLYSGFTYRFQTTHGKWFDRWINSAAGWRWRRWSDGNPWLDDYVGHSMMGAITNYIWIENDPKSMTVEQGNTREYWRRLERAFLFSTAFSFQWKLGPLGEASIGHNGDYYQYENSSIETPTNETGWVELVTTPVGGALWTVGEDALDEHLIARWERTHTNPVLLVAYSFLTPAHATANIFRFRAPWYRDTRLVRASGLFQRRDADDVEVERGVATVRQAHTLPSSDAEPRDYGGAYEFGALLGVSLTHDTAWGSDENNKYMDIVVRGSARLAGNDRAALRWSPEVIAAAMLDEPLPGATDLKYLRTRTYGVGISPVGFQEVLRPTRAVQPYFDQHLGVIGFFKPVLFASRPGENAVYDGSFGAGMNVVRRNGNAVSFGYRLQHLGPVSGPESRATDAHSFYIAVSRFFRSRNEVY